MTLDDPLLAAVLARVSAYTESGDAAAVLSAEALDSADRLVAAASAGAPDGEIPVEVAQAVGLLRLCRYAASADPADLAAATTIFQALGAVSPELVPAGLLDQLSAVAADADQLATQGADLLRAAQDDAEPAVLDRAVAVLDAAVETTPADDPDRAGRLSNLCVALRIRADRNDSADDLDRAVALGEAAVAAIATGDPYRATYRSSYADALHSRFERHGVPADLERAVAQHRRAVEDGADHPARALLHTGLGAALLNLFLLAGEQAHIDEAVAACRQAAKLAPAGSPYFASSRANLGSALAARAGHTGDAADLDAAVTACRDAAGATPVGHPHLAGRLSNLAGVLHTRHVRHRSAADLDAAITAEAAAVSATGPEDPYRGMYLSNLGYMLRVRGEMAADHHHDLDAAVAAGECAVNASPARHPALAGRLSNVGMSLLSRFEAGGDAADLHGAVTALRHAVARSGTADPHRATYRSNLAVALRQLSALGGPTAEAALAEALEQAGRARAELPRGHPFGAGAGLNLGIVHATRFDRRADERDYASAVSAWSAAAGEAAAPLDNRVAAARRWAELAARTGRWPEAATAYGVAVAMLPLLAWRGIGRGDRERLLAGHAQLAGDAVAACLAAGRPDDGVRSLELGRSVSWGLLQATRGDLGRLREAAPELAVGLARVRDALEDIPLPGGY